MLEELQILTQPVKVVSIKKKKKSIFNLSEVKVENKQKTKPLSLHLYF